MTRKEEEKYLAIIEYNVGGYKMKSKISKPPIKTNTEFELSYIKGSILNDIDIINIEISKNKIK